MSNKGYLKSLLLAFVLMLTFTLSVSAAFRSAVRVNGQSLEIDVSTEQELISATSQMNAESSATIRLNQDITLTQNLILRGSVNVLAEGHKLSLSGSTYIDIRNGTKAQFDDITIEQLDNSTAKQAVLFRENTLQGYVFFRNCNITTKSDVVALKAAAGNGNYYLHNTALCGGKPSVDGGALIISGTTTTQNLSENTLVTDFRDSHILENVQNDRAYLSISSRPINYRGSTPEDYDRTDVEIYYTLDETDPVTSGTRMLYEGPVSLIVDRVIKACLVGRGIIYECGYTTFIHDVNEDKTPSDILRVSPIEGRTYRCATQLTKEEFPEAVEIELKDGRKINALADWDLSGINTAEEGEYEAIATLCPPEFVSNPDGITAKISVKIYYHDIEDFTFELYSPLQQAKATATKGYAAGMFLAKGGDEENYTYRVIDGEDYFMAIDGELILRRSLLAGSYHITVEVESAGKTQSADFNIIVEERTYKKIIVNNPYANVDWDAVNFVKTATHDHSYYSSGNFEYSEHQDNSSGSVASRINAYKNFGYGGVIITEHDYVTLKWEEDEYNRDLFAANNVVTLYGNEMSKSYHTLYYGLVDYWDNRGAGKTVTNGVPGNLQNIRALNGAGIAYFAHPYRSTTNNEYWMNLFNEYSDVVYGMEVFNAGQPARNYSEPLWDYILSKTMPNRAIWGSASDDAHSDAAVATGWTTYLLSDSELTREGLFGALKSGASFISTICVNPATDSNRTYENVVAKGLKIPYFKSIKVDNVKGTVTADAADYTKLEWVSADGKVVSTNPTIDLNKTYGVDKYVRCRIYGSGGMCHSQPLGVADGDELYDGDYDPNEEPLPLPEKPSDNTPGEDNSSNNSGSDSSSTPNNPPQSSTNNSGNQTSLDEGSGCSCKIEPAAILLALLVPTTIAIALLSLWRKRKKPNT